MIKNCANCGKPFKVKPCRMDRSRFCCVPCMTAGTQGVRRSTGTEFKKGIPSARLLPVGSVTERIDKNGKRRAFVKIADPNKWKERAVVVWESINGPLQKGFLVHHEDRDTLNDAPGNLSRLSRGEHLSEHRHEHNEKRLANLRIASAKRKAEGRYFGRSKVSQA